MKRTVPIMSFNQIYLMYIGRIRKNKDNKKIIIILFLFKYSNKNMG